MIASHNTFTYLPARQWWARLCPWFWRTQTQNIVRQYTAGVRYFDIRVRRRHGKWQLCHGLVDFNHTYESLAGILERHTPMICRIVLERGDTSAFLRETSHFITQGAPANLHAIIIKKDWNILYHASSLRHPDTYRTIPSPAVIDHTYRPWDTGKSIWHNICHFRPSSIARWARRHPLDEATIPDTTAVHFHDRI